MFILRDMKISQINIGTVCAGQHKIKVNQTHLKVKADKIFLNHRYLHCRVISTLTDLSMLLKFFRLMGKMSYKVLHNRLSNDT